MTIDTKRLRALLAASTPGIWGVGVYSPQSATESLTEPIGITVGGPRFVTWDRTKCMCAADAILIAVMHAQMPAILDRLERLEAVAEAARQASDGGMWTETPTKLLDALACLDKP